MPDEPLLQPRHEPLAEPRRAAIIDWLPVVALVGFVLVMGWHRRWMSDDGFINLRVIRQIGAGHGPVFNENQRVEVTTSPLWMYLVAFLRLVTRMRLELLAVLAGLVTTGWAMVAAAAGSTRLHRVERAGFPVGLVIFAALPVVWDYTTSGLENGLSWAWWATTFLLVVRATVGDDRHGSLSAAFVTGLAPLVRPDLTLAGAVFGAWLLVRVVSDRRRQIALDTGDESTDAERTRQLRLGSARTALTVAAVAGALPLGYQIFRMGYYGQLLPNTVYAKEGGMAWWSRGFAYVGNLVSSYALWLPLLLGLVVLALVGLDRRRQIDGWTAMVTTSVLAAILHALLVARAGGDYMFGRLLLPSVFGLLVPIAVVPLPSRRSIAAPVLGAVTVAAIWAVVVGGWVRPVDHGTAIQDERLKVLDQTGVPHPVYVETHVAYLEDQGIDLRSFGTGDPVLAYGPGPGTRFARDPGQPTVLVFGAMGSVPYRVPLDVWVADYLGLADPLVAHLKLPHRGMFAGHEKYLRNVWWAARTLSPSVIVPPGIDQPNPLLVVDAPTPPPTTPEGFAEARAEIVAALRCGRLAQLEAAYTEPMTAGRFVRNIVGSVGLHGFRFTPDPTAVRGDVCS